MTRIGMPFLRLGKQNKSSLLSLGLVRFLGIQDAGRSEFHGNHLAVMHGMPLFPHTWREQKKKSKKKERKFGHY